MIRTVLEILEQSASRYPQKTAVTDGRIHYTYVELRDRSRRIGSALSLSPRQPVIIFREKGADTLCCLFGALYAGGCYCVLSPELPDARLTQMAAVLQSKTVLTDVADAPRAALLFPGAAILTTESLPDDVPDEAKLCAIRDTAIDTDPLYINFTSGSTGTPKGIAVSHRSVIDFMDCFTTLFHIGEADRIANQAPFDFDVSVKDIYSTLTAGATLVIVPRPLFSAPTALIDFLCEHRVTTLIWAVSALCLISTFHGLSYRTPETINKILFSGEVMPYKHLCCWREHLPDAMLVNLYGPTEITCNCTYHILERDRDYSGGIPIGRAFPNEDVFLLSDTNTRIRATGMVGELCVRGTALALGYYASPAQNNTHFVQNPLNTVYPERIYRTGDLAAYDASGDLVFCGRKDFQIKYRGHRIELEEIERAMAGIDGVERCCCLFDAEKGKLKGFYIGTVEKDGLHTAMKERLPAFMIPGLLRRLDSIPLTKNGKIDRKALATL